MSTQRKFFGTTIDRLSPGSKHKYAAFTAQVWVYGDTLDEIKQAMRDVQGVSRQRNGYNPIHVPSHQGRPRDSRSNQA